MQDILRLKTRRWLRHNHQELNAMRKTAPAKLPPPRASSVLRNRRTKGAFCRRDPVGLLQGPWLISAVLKSGMDKKVPMGGFYRYYSLRLARMI